jgi:PEP-CTERM motif
MQDLSPPLKSFAERNHMKLLKVAMALLAMSTAGMAHSAAVSYNFSGSTSRAMGGVAAGTPFTGTFSYNSSVSGVTTPYFGGTETLFANAYSALTLTIGGQTVTEGAPGTLALYDSVSPPNSIPVGDSLYTFDPLNGQGPLPSSGSFTGLTPNFIYLGFVDSSGTVFTGTSLPAGLSLSSFNSNGVFIGINYGQFGAGNTTTISFLNTLSPVPEPAVAALLMAGLGVLGIAVGLARRPAPRR